VEPTYNVATCDNNLASWHLHTLLPTVDPTCGYQMGWW